MPEIIDSIYLENTKTGHHKFYEAWIAKEGTMYVVKAKYGKIGTSGREIRKISSKFDYVARNKLFSLRNEKMSKGYVVATKPGKVSKKATKSQEPPQPKIPKQLERFHSLLD